MIHYGHSVTEQIEQRNRSKYKVCAGINFVQREQQQGLSLDITSIGV